MIKRTANAFDDWAPTYEREAEAMIRKRGYTYEELGTIIATKLGAAPGLRILEVGTGPGNLGRHVLGASGATIVGLDISIAMIRLARDKSVYSDLSCADAVTLPVRRGAFDGLYSAFVVHSVFRQQRAFDEFFRILRPDGRAIVIDLFPDRSPFVATTLGLPMSIRREHGALARYQPLSTYCAMARAAGFDVLETWQVGERRRYTHHGLTLRKPA